MGAAKPATSELELFKTVDRPGEVMKGGLWPEPM